MKASSSCCQASGRLLLREDIWAWVEKLAVCGYSTRNMGSILFGYFPELQEQFRFEEHPDRANERIAQLIRYHMPEKLRIDYRDWEPVMEGALCYIEDVMKNRYEFDWHGYDPVKDRIEDDWLRIWRETRCRLQWRLWHPYYAPYYTRRYGYRPLPGNEPAQEVVSFYPLEKSI